MGLDKLVIRLVSIEAWWESPCGGFSWRRENERELSTKTYFEVDEDCYIEDEAQANAILKKKRERIVNSPNPRYSDVKTLQPSEALVTLLRKRTGDEKLTSKRIRIMKCIEHRFLGGMNMVYKVEILNRIGNVKQTLMFPLRA